MTIRLKLFLSFIGLSLIPLTLMSWQFYSYTQKTFDKDIKDRLVKLANVERDRLQFNVDADTITQDRIDSNTAGFSDFLGKTGETLIIASNGQGGIKLITPRRFGTAPPSAQIASLGQQKTDAYAEDLIDAYGNHVYAAMAYLPSKDWGIVVKIDRSEVIVPLQALYSTMLLSLIFFVLAIIFLALLVTESILNPIRQLTDTTQAISMGNLRATVDQETLASKDELGDLGRAFDRTLVSLKLAMLSIDSEAPAAMDDNASLKK